MKRSDLFIRLTAAVLFLAVISYVGVLIYNSLMTTFVTTQVIGYTIEETVELHGHIVRSEEVLTDAGIYVLPIVREGERVASGQAIAVELLDSEARGIAAEIRALNLRVAQLEALGGSIDEAGFISVRNLSQAIHNEDFSRLDELALSVQTHVFSGDGLSPADELPQLRSRIALLEHQGQGTRTVHAPRSGTFSQMVDGFEHISPDSLYEISPTEFEELFSNPIVQPGAGKLVTHHRWYFAATIDSADAARIPLGRQMSVHFSGAFHAQFDMLVESVSRREGERAVVVFSSVVSIHDVVALRNLRADLVLGTLFGIHVPREAFHLDDDGTTYIFLQSGVRAERVNVEILRETGDGFLVRDGAETGTPLRVGSTIIVRANNLYHGRIVG